MRVLVVHNYYQTPGGEDQVFHAEARMLRAQGHDVLEYIDQNDRIEHLGKLELAVQTVWSERTRNRLGRVLADFDPDLAHFHNTFPLISPSAYYACRAAGVPVVQTLHNYRLGCPAASYFRDGHVCEDCMGKTWAWPGVVHACYRGDRRATAAVATLNAAHRAVGTWQRQVSVYIALSRFARSKLIASGLPAQKLVVKGNFVEPDPGLGHKHGRFFLFAGRLTPEKGIASLLRAWQRLDPQIPLLIAGDGPLADQVAEAARRMPGITWLGRRPVDEVRDLMGQAQALVLPSEWDEPFGLVAIEAFAKGTPAIAAASGAIPEVVEDRHTGLLYRPGDADGLARGVAWAWAHPQEMAQLGSNARRVFEERFTAEANYTSLLQIYQRVRRVRHRPVTTRQGKIRESAGPESDGRCGDRR